jgi:hypothetical protein
MPPKAVPQGVAHSDTQRAFSHASLSRRRVNEIWNFSHEEMKYLEPLDDKSRTQFKQFAIGYKISQQGLGMGSYFHYRLRRMLMNFAVSAIGPYSTVTEAEKLRYIQVGHDNPDPRHIHDFSPEELDYTSDFSYTLKEVYRIIRVALKSENIELTPSM